MKKTLLQINSVVNIGSTGRIAEEIGQIAIKKGWDSYIAYGTLGKESKSSLIKIGDKKDLFLHGLKTRLFDLHGFGSTKATKELIRKIEEVNPDVIALHNLHGYYINIEILFDFLKKFNKPVFWTLYDCWTFTGHCAYFDMVSCEKWKNLCYNCPAKHAYPQSWLVDNSRGNYKRKKKIFSGIDGLNLIVHSNWLKNNVNQSFLKDYPVHLINNGVNLSSFKPTPHHDLIDKYNLDGKFVILGIANKWSQRKGLNDFILLSKQLSSDEIIILDGLNDEQRKDLPDNILGLERAENVQELSKLYSLGDVFFNPTHEDNFPTTNLEALACGTPVITYNTGGSPEAIDSNTGLVIEKGHIQKVVSAIEEIKVNGKATYSDACINRAKEHFNYKDRYLDYVLLFEKYLDNKTTI